MIQILECLKLSQRFLSLSSLFWILVSSFCFGWMFISSFCSKSLIWVLVSFPSLVGSLYIFLCIILVRHHFFLCDYTQSFLWTSRLPVFWNLHLIGCLSSHCLVLFLEFWPILSFGPYFLSQCTCYKVRGTASYIPQGGATNFFVLWRHMWVRCPRRNNASC